MPLTLRSTAQLRPSCTVSQVRDLLKRKRFQQALELLELCGHEEGGDGGGATEGPAATGAAWLQEALAQAGLLLLLDLQFGEAVQVRESHRAEAPCVHVLRLVPRLVLQWDPPASCASGENAALLLPVAHYCSAIESAWRCAEQLIKALPCMQVLLRCSPAVFQPCELLPLFPSHCQQWLPQLHSRPHWGLHGALPGERATTTCACESPYD